MSGGSGSRTGNALCNTCPATVQITHPAHPLHGQSVSVRRTLQQREGVVFLVEGSDGQVICIPLDWTDQASSELGMPGSKFTVKQLTMMRRWLDSHRGTVGLDRQLEIISLEGKDHFAGGNDDTTAFVPASPIDGVGSVNAAAATTTFGTAGNVGVTILEGAVCQAAACHLEGDE